jgi:hypothetical protein
MAVEPRYNAAENRLSGGSDSGFPGPDGTLVTFEVSATDDNGANVTVKCTPPSGSLFPIGATTVTCTATDDANNTASCSFQVKVNPPPAAVIAHGLAYMPLGQTQLAVDAKGELLVSNLGSSGQDGFRVELGAAEGWEGEVVMSPFGPGEQLHATQAIRHSAGCYLRIAFPSASSACSLRSISARWALSLPSWR